MEEWEGETWRGKWRQNGNIYNEKRWRLFAVIHLIEKQSAQWHVLMKTEIGIHPLYIHIYTYSNLFNCMMCVAPYGITLTHDRLEPTQWAKKTIDKMAFFQIGFRPLMLSYVFSLLQRQGKRLSASVALPLTQLRVRRYLSQFSFSSNS